ncbi:MAG: DUF4231 domain-containing protein [Bacteroidia bacterium]
MDYPSYYKAADKSSKKAQKNYLLIIGLNLSFMIVAATLAIYSFQCESVKLLLYIISGLLLFTSLIFSIVLKTKKFEDVWYQGRALAESVKTLTWRYVTCSEGFGKEVENNVDELFTNRLKGLSNEVKSLAKDLDSEILSEAIITNDMIKYRRESLNERKELYLNDRIKEQKKWYSAKATYNKKRYERWFTAIIIWQSLAIISIVYLIKVPTSSFKLVGVFTTLASATIGWLQLKQHQALTQAYTTAVIELNHIETSASSVDSEDKLSKFVLDSENAISREHTLWLAQKRNN